MSKFLYRLGGLAYRRPRVFIIAWLLILGIVIGFAATGGGRISTSLTIDGTPSQQVLDQLREELPAASGGQGTLVFTVPQGERLDQGERATAIAAAARDIAALPVVVDRPSPAAAGDAAPNGTAPNAAGAMDAALPYHPLVADGSPVPGVLVSTDGSVAMLQIQFTTQVDGLPEGTTDNIVAIAERNTTVSGITVLPSKSLDAMHPPIGGHEAIGLGIALLVLLMTLGSLRAAGLPIITALTGVAIGVGGAFALSESITLTTATPALALMIGLAVGIDYALFVVNRQRRLILIDRLSAADATARAVATAGSAVVFAGSTVIIALAGLTIIGIGFLTTMALVAAATVGLAVLIALTLLPALLGVVGEGICSTKARAAGRAIASEEERHLANRWVGFLVRRPWVAIAGALVVVALAAIPAQSMSLGMPTGATNNLDSSSRQSYDAITRGFGEGFNAPLIVVAHPGGGATLDQQDIGAITAGLKATGDVATATLMGASLDGSLAIFTVIPEQGPDDASTAQLVEALRSPDSAVATSADVTLGVTGLTAVNIDISGRLGDVLPEYIAIIVGLSLLLLLFVFRSVVIPIKATVGFLLSIAATFGLTTAVFQGGWLMGLVGVDTSGPLLSFLPIMVTGILYGLAMDYEVFLVSSMREARIHGMPARRAIVHGFDHASRVVVAAAVIMTSVFASFILSEDPMIKQFGFALAVGVLIDAFLVRMTLVPAVMSLLDDRAWWLPRGLDRLLPSVDIEGEGHVPESPVSQVETLDEARA
ncbi:MAG: MMPL family transporter [Candidatus Limnocylindrales bacterium]